MPYCPACGVSSGPGISYCSSCPPPRPATQAALLRARAAVEGAPVPDFGHYPIFRFRREARGPLELRIGLEFDEMD